MKLFLSLLTLCLSFLLTGYILGHYIKSPDLGAKECLVGKGVEGEIRVCGYQVEINSVEVE